MRKPLKNYRISAQGFYRSQKPLKRVLSRVFVIGVQLKWHNFWQWESFRGLVDIPKIRFSWINFGEGRTVWAI